MPSSCLARGIHGSGVGLPSSGKAPPVHHGPGCHPSAHLEPCCCCAALQGPPRTRGCPPGLRQRRDHLSCSAEQGKAQGPPGPDCSAVPSLLPGVIPGSPRGCRDAQGEQGAATALAKAQPFRKGPWGAGSGCCPRSLQGAEGRQLLASHTEPGAQDICDTLHQSRQRKMMIMGVLCPS